MIKVLMAIIIVVICGMVGLLVANNFKLRPWQLRQIQTSLQLLETEIAYAQTPLPEAFSRISQQVENPVSKLYSTSARLLNTRKSCNLQESWQQGLTELMSEGALIENDIAILKVLGFNLGSTDKEEQIKHLRLAKEQLKQQELAAEEEKTKGERLWRYCGFLTGLIIVILIL
ncbi:MAG: stage III sporulation protein SpoIIIAB [Bacillota bacterium]|nr:stage III sporulation protein SpoIIIAB [Bacillota bacterium]